MRIPAEFRLSTDRVQITRTPEGDLVIHLCPPRPGQALLEGLGGFDPDFLAALVQQQAATAALIAAAPISSPRVIIR